MTEQSAVTAAVVSSKEAEATDASVSAPSQAIIRDVHGRFAAGSGRPARRRPGATAGNLNAVTNPWITYWKRRALRPEDRWALALVRDYVPQLEADKGGAAAMTAAERRLAELAGTSRVCWALALAAQRWEDVARFAATETRCLVALGLERRPRQEPDLADVLRAAADGVPSQETAR